MISKLNTVLIASFMMIGFIGQAHATSYEGKFIKAADALEVYLVQKGKKRWIENSNVLFDCGLSWSAVDTISSTIVDGIPTGDSISTAESCIDALPAPKVAPGDIIKSHGAAIYVIDTTGNKRQLSSMTILDGCGITQGSIIYLNKAYLDSIPSGSEVQTRDECLGLLPTVPTTIAQGSLIKGNGDEIYIMDKGEKRLITTPDVFSECLNWSNVSIYENSSVQSLPSGNSISTCQDIAKVTSNDPPNNSCGTFDVGPSCQYIKIQDAIDAVTTAGVVINVAKGTYRETLIVNNKQNLTINGAYSTVTAKESGDGLGWDRLRRDNKRPLTVRNSKNLTMNNFTLTGGAVPPPPGRGNQGGGIYIDGKSSLKLNDSYVTYNLAGTGGGVYLGIKAVFEMVGGTIDHNRADYNHLAAQSNGSAGAMFVPNSAIAKLTKVTINNNSAEEYISAIQAAQYSTICISGSTIRDNHLPSNASHPTSIYGALFFFKDSYLKGTCDAPGVVVCGDKNKGSCFAGKRQENSICASYCGY